MLYQTIMNVFRIIQQNDMIKVLLVLVAVYIFMKYYKQENLDNTDAVVDTPKIAQLVDTSMDSKPAMMQTMDQAQQVQVDKIVAGSTQLSTEDLLPKYDDANDFAKENPVSKLLQDQNFLTSGYHMGINTIVQCNKITYNDLRSCPPIQNNDSVSPWMNSSFENPVGAGRRQFELN